MSDFEEKARERGREGTSSKTVAGKGLFRFCVLERAMLSKAQKEQRYVPDLHLK